MKIAFVVNTTGLTGGIKVVFEHANRLAKKGHEVYVIHLLSIGGKKKAYLKKLKYMTCCGDVDWFKLENVKILRLINLEKMPDCDVVIATANETADFVAKLPKNKGEKFYFVQGYEDWTRDKKLVDATYKLPLKKIVIASWLKHLMEKEFNEKTVGLVINGVDFDHFSCPRKLFNEPKKILMMYHKLPLKGFKYGLEAFTEVNKRFPKVKLVLFGAYRLVENLPKEIDFYFKPESEKLMELYQSSDIFVSPSLQEGCQLPPMEAMAAQCAVVATDVGGVPDYAIAGKTALIVPPKDSQALGKALIELLDDESRLKEIAKNGYEHIQNYTWEKASDKFEKILKEQVNK